MKKIFLLTIILGISILSFSQKDPEAQQVLDKLSEKTKSYTDIQADFNIHFKDIKENIENNSAGTIAMKGDMYRLNFMGSEAFYDGKTLWNYLPEEKEVNISEPEADSEDIFNNPKKLFTIYENNYKYQLINNSTEKGVKYSIIDLYPIDIDQEYSRIRLQINTSKFVISSATIFGKDGSHYTITLKNYKFNKNLLDTHFKFFEKDHKNVEIIDMRF